MRTVLLVESHSDTRELYAEFLAYSGFRVHATDGARTARLDRIRTDAVVVCVSRRDSEDRLEFVRTLRGEPRGQAVAILAVSSGAFPWDQAAAHAAGCDVFLTKPCMPIDLAREVRHAIMQRRRAFSRN